jgi:hypothetical protein
MYVYILFFSLIYRMYLYVYPIESDSANMMGIYRVVVVMNTSR